jgi:hypothetical protein
MPSFQGQLLKDGQALYRVSGRLQFQSTEGGVRVWSGHFALPLEAQNLEHGPYRLTLDDGRSGDIQIDSVSVRGLQSMAYFRGLGDLH